MNELSLFSGYGGFSLGLRLAGLQTRTVAYVEWDKYPQEIIKARIKDGYLDDAPIFSDISSFRGEQFRGLVDVLTAGFPCQPHSVAGLQRGADDDRNKWPDTLRVIREVEPRWVILENVPGLLSASVDGGRPAYGGTVVGELATLGYSVHWQTLGASDVGAPHRRKRWWCIGVADSERERESSGIWSSKGVSGSRTQTTNPSVRQGRDSSIEGSVNIRHNAYNGGGSTGELADSDSNGEGKRHNSDTKRGYPREIPEGRDSQGTQDKSPYAYNDSDITVADSDLVIRGARKESREPAWGATGQPSGNSSRNMVNSEGEWSGRVRDKGSKEGASDSDVLSGVSGRLHSEQLADSNNEGLEGIGANGHQAGWQEPDVSLGLFGGAIPVWPPSPNDTDGWEWVIRERPDLSPALTKEAESQFRRMDDGRSNRVDELKALGNGIVPAVLAEFLHRVLGPQEGEL